MKSRAERSVQISNRDGSGCAIKPLTGPKDRRFRLHRMRSKFAPLHRGWKLHCHYHGLFYVFTARGKWLVELDSRLALIDERFRRGHKTKEDLNETAIMVNALWYTAAAAQELNHRDNGLALEIAGESMAKAIGKPLIDAFRASNESRAGIEIDNLKQLFNKALDGLMRLKYPGKAVGSGKAIAEERIVILCARELCEKFKRLPTQREVREAMMQMGYGPQEGKSKGIKGRWKDLFRRSGFILGDDKNPVELLEY